MRRLALPNPSGALVVSGYSVPFQNLLVNTRPIHRNAPLRL